MCGGGSTIFVSYVDEALETDAASCCGAGYANPDALKLVPKLAAKVGEPLAVTIERDGEPQTLEVNPAELPQSPKRN